MFARVLLVSLAFVVGCSGADTPPPSSAEVTASPAKPAPACLGLGPDDACAGSDAPISSGTTQNVLGTPLQVCSTDPMTGWTREGVCTTGPRDTGVHVVCAEMTNAFLEFTKERGNDLSTPSPQFGFPGLEAGDRWCLCAARWDEAKDAGVAPPAVLDATHEAALRIVDRSRLGL